MKSSNSCMHFGTFSHLQSPCRFVNSCGIFRFDSSDIEYLQSVIPHGEPEFFQWLQSLDCSRVRVYSMPQGGVCLPYWWVFFIAVITTSAFVQVVFPKEPLLRIEGPLAVCQLLETVLLNLTNFPSLIATNATRMRLAAGPDKTLLEFGLRRAQGPDGALTATKYAYVGGFDGTSNVLAGKLLGIAVSTHIAFTVTI